MVTLGGAAVATSQDSVSAQGPVSSAATGPTTSQGRAYTLYVGADLEVPKDDAFYRMHRFTNYAAEIRVDGRAQRIPIGQLKSMRVGRDMKLSRDIATVSGAKVTRAYSAARDPFRMWASSGLTPGADAQIKRERNPNMPQPDQGMGGAGVRSLMFEITEIAGHDTFTNSGNNLTNTPEFVARAENERAKEGFDAIQAEFAVSSEKELSDCYMLLICDFKMEKKSDALQRWIHLKTLGDITPKARKVHFVESGLPPGFILVNHEFHLYSGEREVATNLSEKRIELSEEEAFTFMNLQYIGTHRGETLPPVVAWSDVPRDLADRLPPDVLRWPIYVKVDADGRVVSMSADKSGRRAVPHRVENAIKGFRFNPALAEGKPVPGEVVVRIADFLPPLPE